MAFVITSPCLGEVAAACVGVCPVDAIHGPVTPEQVAAIPAAERKARLVGLQMFIDPDVCIDCGACAAACPAGAIFADTDVPPAERDAIERNARFFTAR